MAGVLPSNNLRPDIATPIMFFNQFSETFTGFYHTNAKGSYFSSNTLLLWSNNQVKWWVSLINQEGWDNYNAAGAQLNQKDKLYYWVAFYL